MGILKEGLTISALNGISDEAVIHLYLHCSGLDKDFIFNPIGEDARRLKHFYWNAALEAVVDKFAEIIQSGKPVVLDRFTTFSVVGHKPPPKFFLF